ncbi:MAG: S-ribosylhomocysteine lyase [Ruminococcaceae bacterium]|nr:S-ribosylhomocysteine lyase [Oscillospiraceae bacterium]
MKPKKIASFTIDHNKLKEGIYVSRIDGDIVTYDLRTRKPNMGDYMDNITMHSVEHMIATYIRSSKIGGDVIYFGPMGCRTGFYLLVRNGKNDTVLETVKETLEKVIIHEGEVFGASRIECGNYKELDIDAAKKECARYLEILNGYTPDFKYE